MAIKKMILSWRSKELDSSISQKASLNSATSVPQKLKKKLERDIERHKHLRSSQRQKTFITSEMTFPDKEGISIMGAIIDFSEGGLTFKPITNYLEYRENRNIEIHFSGLKKSGIIRSSRPDGYGIQVFEKFSAEEMEIVEKAWLETCQQLEERNIAVS